MTYSKFEERRHSYGQSRYSGGQGGKGTYARRDVRDADITAASMTGMQFLDQGTVGRSYRAVRDPQERNQAMETAWCERLSQSQRNAECFTAACLVVKNTHEDRVHAAQSSPEFVALSKYLSWLFRASALFHEDGSLSLSELLSLPQLQNHLRRLRSNNKTELFGFSDRYYGEVLRDQKWKERRCTVQFLAPLAFTIMYNNKGRFQIGYLQNSHLTPDITGGKMPSAVRDLQCPPAAWKTFAGFDADEIRAGTWFPADCSVQRIYFRAISGHKKISWLDLSSIQSAYYGEEPDITGFLVHGTQEYHLRSIEHHGLKPGGNSGHRKHIHMISDTFLETNISAIRETTDILLFFNPVDITAYGPVRSPNGYILVEQDIDPIHILGVWSLKESLWLSSPNQYWLRKLNPPGVPFGQPSTKRRIVFATILHGLRNAAVADQTELFGGRTPGLEDLEERVSTTMRDLSRMPAMKTYWENRLNTTAAYDASDRRTVLRPKIVHGEDEQAPELEPIDEQTEAVFQLVKSRLAMSIKERKRESNLSTDDHLDVNEEEEAADERKKKKEAGITANKGSEPASSSTRPKTVYDRRRSRTPIVRRKDKTAEKPVKKEKVEAPSKDAGITAAPPLVTDDQACEHCGRPATFACKQCHKMACVKCAFASMCRCGHNHLRCDVPEEIQPPDVELDLDADSMLYKESRYYGDSPEEVKKYQEECLHAMYERVYEGKSTGDRSLDRAIRYYGQAENDLYDSYDVPAGQAPDLQEFFDAQDSSFPDKIFRPSTMLTATKHDPPDVLLALKEIYRHALTNRTGPREPGYQVETNHIGITILNLGDVNRDIHVGGSSKLYSDMQDTKCLPHLVARNPGHVVVLLESNGISDHAGIMADQGLFGMEVAATRCGNSIACFCRGDPSQGSYIELLAHVDEATQGQKPMWLVHGCVFRIVFGKQTEGTHFDQVERTRRNNLDNVPEDTGITVQPHPGPIDTTRGSDDVIKACSDILANESTADHPPIVTGSQRDVRRCGLPEVRILAFHLNSKAFHKKYMSGCAKWIQCLYAGITAQVDFIVGDGNLFAQRNYSNATGSDFYTSILVDLLERILGPLNADRSIENQISYNIVSSTSSLEWVKAQKGLHADTDSMICIALCYGKQISIRQERVSKAKDKADRAGITAFSEEIILKERERVKHLQGYDIGLDISDAAWHSPLLVHAVPRSLKNVRTRSEAKAKARSAAQQEHNERRRQEREERREEKGKGKGDDRYDDPRSKGGKGRPSSPRRRTEPEPFSIFRSRYDFREEVDDYNRRKGEKGNQRPWWNSDASKGRGKYYDHRDDRWYRYDQSKGGNWDYERQYRRDDRYYDRGYGGSSGSSSYWRR